MSSEEAELADWWRSIVAANGEAGDAIHEAYQQLENAGLISKVTVHQYRCRRCGPVATVIRIADATIIRTRDYKFGPGMNLERSVPTARAKNTLDGNSHWPGHTLDVAGLASWGEVANIDMNCRHRLRSVRAVDILSTVEGVTPGHPGKPTLF